MNRDELIEKVSQFSAQVAVSLLAHDGYTESNRPTGFLAANYARFADAALFTSIPLIEADVRERIATEIEQTLLLDGTGEGWDTAIERCLDIARGADQ